MAPKRKVGARKAAPAADKLPSDDVEKQEVPASAEAVVVAAEEEASKADAEPSPKKTKVEEKKKRGQKPKAPAKKAVAATKKTADDDSKDSGDDIEDVADEEAPGSDKAGKVIVIEASKECNCFKTSAAKVQTGLTKAIPGIEVLINPDKPRKGCFEVREREGKVYMSLLGMPRPFTKLKSLDMDKAVEDIVTKLK
eukprot:c25439_g1_i1 orf=368-955(-)